MATLPSAKQRRPRELKNSSVFPNSEFLTNVLAWLVKQFLAPYYNDWGDEQVDNIAKSHFYTEPRIALLELVKSLHDANHGKSVQCSSNSEFAFSNVPQKCPKANLVLRSRALWTTFSCPPGYEAAQKRREFDILTVHYACNNNILKIFIRLFLTLTIVLTLHFSFH